MITWVPCSRALVGTAEAAGLAGSSAHGLTRSSCMGTAVVLLRTISEQSYRAAVVKGSELFTADSPLKPAGIQHAGSSTHFYFHFFWLKTLVNLSLTHNSQKNKTKKNSTENKDIKDRLQRLILKRVSLPSKLAHQRHLPVLLCHRAQQ